MSKEQRIGKRRPRSFECRTPKLGYYIIYTDTKETEENYIDGLIRVYNNEICNTLDNYNCSAYYEPSYVIARAYQAGGF